MAKVKLNQESVFQYNGVLLFPEWNTVTEEEIAKLKTANIAIEQGILEFESEKASKKQ